MKKLSELMLEGYAMVGKQCKYKFYSGVSYHKPVAVCAEGAANLAATGDAGLQPEEVSDFLLSFSLRTGVDACDLNDEGMSIPDIAGIAAAEGL